MNKIEKLMKDTFKSERKNNMRYEVYEDNGGGIYLHIIDEDTSAIFSGYEQYSFSLHEALDALRENPKAYTFWDIDEAETLAIINGRFEGTLIAWGDNERGLTMIEEEAMGQSARDCLALEK